MTAPVKHIAQFICMGWYIGGLAIGAFLWQSVTLGVALGVIAFACYFVAKYAERRWTWEQFQGMSFEDDEL